MKTERRHELQTNVLADWLGNKAEELKPYSRAIVGGAVAIAVVLFTVIYLSGKTTKELEQGWADYFAVVESQDVSGLREVADKHAATDVGLWARQSESDLLLQEGISQLYIDRDDADSKLSKAQDGYLVVSQNAKDPMLKRRGTFGLAQTYEARNNLEDAEKSFGEIASRWPETMIGKESQRRLEQLKDESIKEFYAWFFEQEPRRRQASLPQSPSLPSTPSPIFDDTGLNFDLDGPSGIGPQPDPESTEPTEPATDSNAPPTEDNDQPAEDGEPTDEPTGDVTEPGESDLGLGTDEPAPDEGAAEAPPTDE